MVVFFSSSLRLSMEEEAAAAASPPLPQQHLFPWEMLSHKVDARHPTLEASFFGF